MYVVNDTWLTELETLFDLMYHHHKGKIFTPLTLSLLLERILLYRSFTLSGTNLVPSEQWLGHKN